MARSIAWFGTWPRSGIELDNFLECGPFDRMDGSHLCHHGLCVNPNHIVYEPSYVNQDRARCYDLALALRRDCAKVPPSCAKHSPPCMLQVSRLYYPLPDGED